MLVVSPRILALGIFQHLADGAVSTRHIPDRTRDFVQYDRTPDLGGHCHLLQGLIAAVNHGKQAVGTLLTPEEHSVETHPLGTSQGCCLHILGTLYQRDVDILHLAIASAVLEGRQEDGIGMLVDKLFYNRTHGVATVRDAPLCHLFVDIGHLDVFQVGHPCYLVLGMQHLQQGTMHRGKDDAACQRRADNGSLGKMGRQLGIRRHQDIAVQHLTFLPGVLQRCHGIALVAHHRQFAGILESKGVATVLQHGSLSATGR